MSWLDWGIIILFFAYTLWDGMRQSSKTHNVEDLLLARRSMPWWAIGISVMATQASAISFIATTGFAYMHDMSFLQVYFGLPIAMVILCITLVPFFHKAKIFTAYEILEKRFGLRVRLTTSFLFLLSRGLAMGTIIAAPAYVLALILNIPLAATILITGITATIYTVFGGITGVIRTDIKQMVIMISGLVFCFFFIIYKLPASVGLSDSLHLAGALGKLEILEWEFDPSKKYTVWSGLLAGLFLSLSYFGSDQTQVQRYLTAKSLDHARGSLILSAFAKIPMMFFMLFIGAMIYVFFIFRPAPILFVPELDEDIITTTDNQEEFSKALAVREQMALQYLEDRSPQNKASLRESDSRCSFYRDQQIVSLTRQDGVVRNDTNYVLPYFVLNELPSGIIGLIIAAIFAAAFSSMDSGLNSLAASTTVDWYRRLRKDDGSDEHYLKFTRWSTAFWGIFATVGALILGEARSLIELVNQIGSYFYGSILGVFLLIFIKKINGLGALVGLIVGILSVLLVDSFYYNIQTDEVTLYLPELVLTGLSANPPEGFVKSISYLWLNPIGAGVVLTVGYVVSLVRPNQ